MAGEEDVELRELVAQTLETKGVLGKIRAQLRASVFLALEEHDSEKKPHPLASSKLADFLKTKDGQVATALVREFLEFFEMDYTCAVFDPESNALESYPGREKLAQDLGIEAEESDITPLLTCVLQKSRQPPPPSTATKHLKFPEHPAELRTSNSTHPPNRRSVDDSHLPPLSLGKLVPIQENDIPLRNSTLASSLQPLTNSLNTNDNSNLHPELPQENIVSHNGLDKARDISIGSLNDHGIHAELGETFVNDNSLDIEKLLNSTEDLEKVAQLAGVKTGTEESDKDELDNFFDNAHSLKHDPSKSSSFMSEDLSVPLSSVTAKFETEDLTLSGNSLPGDFDYAEQVQS